MAFINDTTSVIKVRLTNLGREYLASGKNFNITKYVFGDSEIDYSSANITGSPISYPNIKNYDLSSKLYYRGTVPIGNSYIAIEPYVNIYEIPKFGSFSIRVNTIWGPIVNYYEEYNIINLGPLENYNIIITKIGYNEFTISAGNVAGSTQLKIIGLTSNKYQILNVDVTDNMVV